MTALAVVSFRGGVRRVFPGTSGMAGCAGLPSYAGSRPATWALPWRTSVRAPPGSTMVTPVPNGAASWATDSANPVMPHWAAW
jgi:hypothetical protein